jgi:hypothetical protein
MMMFDPCRPSIERHKRSIVISGVVRFPASLLDDDPFGVARTTSHSGVYVILPISASWQAALAVLKVAPPDIARQRRTVTLLEQLEQVAGFLRRCGDGRGVRSRERAECSSVSGARVSVGCDGREQPCGAGRAQQQEREQKRRHRSL